MLAFSSFRKRLRSAHSSACKTKLSRGRPVSVVPAYRYSEDRYTLHYGRKRQRDYLILWIVDNHFASFCTTFAKNQAKFWQDIFECGFFLMPLFWTVLYCFLLCTFSKRSVYIRLASMVILLTLVAQEAWVSAM